MQQADTTEASRHRLIDADTHVNEPPNLWLDRVPARFREQVPRIQRFEEGDAWVMEGVKDPINFGLNAGATLRREERRPWVRFEDIPRGGYDPVVRLQEMDADLVDAAVLYPTPRLSHLVIATPEPDRHLVMVQAYNDWLAEYASHDTRRLGGVALIPNRGVEQAVAEIRRVASLPGIVGLLVGCYPHGDKDLAPEDDVVWEAALEVGLPLHVHVSLEDSYPEDIYAPGRMSEGRAKGDLRFLNAPAIMVQFLNSGVFDRLPELHVVFVEVDAGWVPYVKEQLDNRFRRRAVGPEARLRLVPSEVVEEHFSFTYITDTYAIRNRHAIGVHRLLWSSDFPHSGADWPDSWRTIDSVFDDVPRAERDLILAGNADRLYRFSER
jgi:predicted TIM-barrel fold metal-dependent hydrolase